MFKYYNPHPKGLSTNDCVKRAIVVVTGRTYSDVQRELNGYKRVSRAKRFNSIENLRYVEDVLKAKRINFRSKPTVSDFCKKHPKGRFILATTEHWVGCVDGCIYDTWDCRQEAVECAYEVNTEGYTAVKIKAQAFKNCCTSEKCSETEALIRIYDGNGCFVERRISTEDVSGYVLCLMHENYRYIDLG
jgi:hypothetical protein